MIRKNITKTPDLILCADIHLRDTVPICRTDDFLLAQWNKLDFISDLQKKYGCPVYHSGDLFHKWKPSPWLISKALHHLPDQFYSIFGNHDLPEHNINLKEKSGLWTLYKAGKVQILPGIHWNQSIEEYEKNGIDQINIKGRNILVWHVMSYQRILPYPGCESPKSSTILRKYPQYDLILTGHNHQTFVEEHEGRLFINPGAMTRQTADMDNYLFVNKPSVYLWYAEDNTYDTIYIPIEEGVISRDHIEKKEERDNRIDAFITKLENDWEGVVDFDKNLERMMEVNKTRQSVKLIVHRSMNDGNYESR